MEQKNREEEQKKEEQKREDQRRERVRRKKMHMREKGRKVAKHCVFAMMCGSRGLKSRLAKSGGCGAIWPDMKNCTPLWREAHVQVKMYKTHQLRTTFRSCDVEKVYAVVARSAFRSQNVENSTCWRHFWTFGCRFAWQAQGIVDLVKSEQNVRVL